METIPDPRECRDNSALAPCWFPSLLGLALPPSGFPWRKTHQPKNARKGLSQASADTHVGSLKYSRGDEDGGIVCFRASGFALGAAGAKGPRNERAVSSVVPCPVFIVCVE